LVVAIGVAAYGLSRESFWLGALAVILLWWADNDRKRSRERDREEQLVAEFAPELKGMSFVEASKYILDAADRFKASATPALRQRFADMLAEHQAEWNKRGQPMPLWASLQLLRTLEAASSENVTPHTDNESAPRA
jgi:hypothetical protein